MDLRKSITQTFYSTQTRSQFAHETRIFVVKGPAQYLGRSFPLSDEKYSIGRKGDNEICFDIKSISKHHCVIERDLEKRFTIRDLGSLNHTYVNGRKLEKEERAPLLQGDQITISSIQLLFVDPHVSASAAELRDIEIDFDSVDAEAEAAVSSFFALSKKRKD